MKSSNFQALGDVGVTYVPVRAHVGDLLVGHVVGEGGPGAPLQEAPREEVDGDIGGLEARAVPMASRASSISGVISEYSTTEGRPPRGQSTPTFSPGPAFTTALLAAGRPAAMAKPTKCGSQTLTRALSTL